ncbi:MAG: tetratricopeptide repeat protein [Candidatus Theseobacter exili]|nr:tetratricopeptide repeat protein [Candidatus Theseobacter exili]
MYKNIYPLYRDQKERKISGGLAPVLKAHNDYLQVASETGLLGIIFFICLLLSSFKVAFGRISKIHFVKEVDSYALAIGLGLAAMSIHGLFSFPLQVPASLTVFWLYIGLLAVVEESGKEKVIYWKPVFSWFLFSLSIAMLIWACWVFTMKLSAQVLLKKGSRSLNIGKIEESISILISSAAKNSNDVNVQNFLGKAYAMRGGIEKSLFHYKNGLKIYPYNDFSYNNIGILLEKQRKYAGAMKWFRAALELNRDSAESNYNLWKALIRSGKTAEAKEIVNRILSMTPHYGQAFIARGLCRDYYGDTDGAIKDMRKSIGIDPVNPEAYDFLGIILSKKGEYNEAKKFLQKSVELAPFSTAYKINLASIMLKNGEAAKAEELYRRVLTNEPDNVHALYNLGLLLKAYGRENEAEKLFEQLKQVDPEFFYDRKISK